MPYLRIYSCSISPPISGARYSFAHIYTFSINFGLQYVELLTFNISVVSSWKISRSIATHPRSHIPCSYPSTNHSTGRIKNFFPDAWNFHLIFLTVFDNPVELTYKPQIPTLLEEHVAFTLFRLNANFFDNLYRLDKSIYYEIIKKYRNKA